MDLMILIDNNQTSALTSLAKENPRKRKNLNFHSHDGDPINRMLNAFEPQTYVRPHKHQQTNKREVFIILCGQLAVFFFDNDGHVINRIILDSNNGVFGVEIDAHEWHTAVSLASGTVVYEVKDGPYDMHTDKEFAPWAPQEGSLNASEYLKELLRYL